MAKKKDEWLMKGHGELQDLQTEKDFFSAMKGEEKMVVHFYRDNWPCKVMDKHLRILAKKHLETKFCQVRSVCVRHGSERYKDIMEVLYLAYHCRVGRWGK
jgi:hypothetical protein